MERQHQIVGGFWWSGSLLSAFPFPCRQTDSTDNRNESLFKAGTQYIKFGLYFRFPVDRHIFFDAFSFKFEAALHPWQHNSAADNHKANIYSLLILNIKSPFHFGEYMPAVPQKRIPFCCDVATKEVLPDVHILDLERLQPLSWFQDGSVATIHPPGDSLQNKHKYCKYVAYGLLQNDKSSVDNTSCTLLQNETNTLRSTIRPDYIWIFLW